MMTKTGKKTSVFYRSVAFLLIFVVGWSGIFPSVAAAQAAGALPVPATIVSVGPEFNPMRIMGMRTYAQEPFRFDVLVDKGDSHLDGAALREEVSRLSKYFLACLAVPDQDKWVNLSPYEKDRITPDAFGITQMGKDLLEQDYRLKQVAASITYPETPLGARFWKQVYARMFEFYGTTDVPAGSFNKVWIIPKSGEVYVHGDSALVVKSSLDVMLDTDYQALKNAGTPANGEQYARVYTDVFRSMILPELRREVNEGRNFTAVRQVYDALILATWYKKHVMNGLLSRMYVGQNKVTGIDIEDRSVREKVFAQYMASVQQGVYNYIREEVDPGSQEMIPRKYLSGGVTFTSGLEGVYAETVSPAMVSLGPEVLMAPLFLDPVRSSETGRFADQAQSSSVIGRWMRQWCLAGALAIAGLALAPSAQAATFAPSLDGKATIVHVEKGDTYGAIVEQMRVMYHKTSPAAYKASVFNGPLWGSDGVVARLADGKDVEHLTVAQVLRVDKEYSSAALEQLPQQIRSLASETPGAIADSARDDGATERRGAIYRTRNNGENITATDLVASRPGIPTATPVSVASGAVDKVVSWLVEVKDKIPAPSFWLPSVKLTSVKMPALSFPDIQWSRFNWRERQSWPILGGLFGLVCLVGYKRPRYSQEGATQGGSGAGAGGGPGDDPLSGDENALIGQRPEATTGSAYAGAGYAGPGPTQGAGASSGESVFLQQDLAGMQALLAGNAVNEEPLELPVMNMNAKMSVAESGFPWLEGVGALTGLGVAYALFGQDSVSRMLPWLALPFATRIFYSLQIGAHEFGHMIAGAAVTGKWREAFSGKNLRANMTWKERAKLLLPFGPTRDIAPYVDIPSAKGSRVTRWAGITASTLLGASGVLALGLAGWGALPLMGPWVAATAGVLRGQDEDINGSRRTECGQFPCGINGVVTRARPHEKIALTLKKLLGWQEKMLRVLEDRGGQQMGLFTSIRTRRNGTETLGVKTLKNKRWLRWEDGGVVFYPDMIGQTVKKLRGQIPSTAEALETLGRPAVVGSDGHVRFATGGEIVQPAAHPHVSSIEEKIIEAFDDTGVLRRVGVPVNVEVITQTRAAHNGDNDGVNRDSPLLARPFGPVMELGAMRRFFPAVIHMYYGGKITEGYLKHVIGPLLPAQHPTVNYSKVIKALKASGYVVDDRVSRRFTGVDDTFRQGLSEYEPGFFSLLESALFGLPVGDSPVIPLQVHFYMTQGNWDASLRYAHVMVNHHNDIEALSDVLFEDEETELGSFFRRQFDRARPYLVRRGFLPRGRVKSLADLWFKDAESARQAGAAEQYQIMATFLAFLEQQMASEARKDTVSGRMFRHWETEWAKAGLDGEEQRRHFAAVAAEQYFTADRPHATREFAARSDGTYGIYVRTTLFDDGVTVYSNQQDVAVGINEVDETLAWASDPRVLKTIGPNGEHLEKVILLKDGEVMDLGFNVDKGVKLEAWTPAPEKGWRAVTQQEIERRLYPTAQVVDGQPNPYYAPPPVEYEPRRRMVERDLLDTPAIIAKAAREWDDPRSFNRRSAANFAKRLASAKERAGTARLLVVGYDNSLGTASALQVVLKDMVEGVNVEFVDPNAFSDDPDAFHIDDDTVALVVSKSGATFSTKLAANILKKLMPLENIFGMTARTDSVLNSILGQGLQPRDPFTERIFLTGEFYPSEAPVVSEILLLHQQMRLGLELAREFAVMPGAPVAVKVPPSRIKALIRMISSEVVATARQSVGVDEQGRTIASEDSDRFRSVGDTLGKHAVRPFIKDRIMDGITWSVFKFGAPLGAFMAGAWLYVSGYKALAVGLGVAVPSLDFLAVRFGLPYYISEKLSKRWGLPANGRVGARKLIIAAPPSVGRTQRNFFSRLFANGTASTSPSAIYYQDPNSNLVTEHGSDVTRGDILLNLTLEHAQGKGRMSLKQVTFPKTGAFFGLDKLKGRATVIDVPVTIPQTNDPLENRVIDETLGTFALMMASKAIGVKMAMVASSGGRLWNPGETWNRAGVHTTPTPIGLNARVKEILARPDYRVTQAGTPTEEPELTAVGAGAFDAAQKNGGIDMDGRRVNLTETGSEAMVPMPDTASLSRPFNGLTPRIGVIVPVSPAQVLAALQ